MSKNKYDKKEMEKKFKHLKKEIEEAGLTEKAGARGIIEMGIVTILFIASIISIYTTNPIITILLFVLTIMRATYVAHDLIHGQYLDKKVEDKKLSYFFANVIMGISSSWWNNKHNVLHHTFTNIIGKDTDIDAGGKVWQGKKEFIKYFHKNQHILFWFLLPLIYFSFWFSSIKYVLKNKECKELLLLELNLIIPILIISQYGIGYGLFIITTIYMLWSLWFGLVIVTNHLGLETFEEKDFNDFSFLELQTRTSRNVKGGKIIHWIYGGLNTQTEHHLYPRAPRFYLLKAAKITEEFCKKNNINYNSKTPIETYKELYDYLYETRIKD
jgi:fatty acid desaturase